MKLIPLLTALLLLLPFYNTVSGQVALDAENQRFTNDIHEKIFLFTDRDLYLAGEFIWFSFFTTLNGKHDQELPDKVLYVELLDKTNHPVQKGKYKIHGNSGHGSLQIPAETLSEIYFLRAYTRFMRNQGPESFSLIPLTVINPEFTLPPFDQGSAAKISENANTASLVISANKSIFDSREKVELSLSFKGQKPANCCVSVIRYGTGGFPQSSFPMTKKIGPQREDSLFWVPDIRDISFSGFLKEKRSGLPAAEKEVFLSVMGENPILHITETNPNGSFIFSLDELRQIQEVYIGIRNGNGYNNEILINNDFYNEPFGLPDMGFPVDSTYRNILTEMLVNRQIQMAFDRPQVKFLPSEEKESMLFGKYDFTVRPDEYIDLASLEEVIYEIVPPVSVRKSADGSRYFVVANYESGRLLENDVLLLDNVPVFDVDELLKIPPSNIERIDVINRPYFLGSKKLENVIVITTKTSDFGGYQFPEESIFLEYLCLADETAFISPSYENESGRESPVPDFRTVLFWEPQVRIEASGTDLDFYTSDNKGQYDIIVRGIDSEGNAIFNKTSIWIR